LIPDVTSSSQKRTDTHIHSFTGRASELARMPEAGCYNLAEREGVRKCKAAIADFSRPGGFLRRGSLRKGGSANSADFNSDLWGGDLVQWYWPAAGG